MADARMQTTVVLARPGGEIALGKSSPVVYFITAQGEGLGREGRD